MIRELYGTIDDFCSYELTSPRFLLQGIIPYYGTGLIHGKRGHGKTQLALTLARGIVNGEKFLDYYQCSYGRVAYCSFDLPIAEVHKRLNDFRASLHRPDNFYVYASDAPKDFYAMAQKGKLEPWISDLLEFEPDLIVLDTLRKCHHLDENSNAVPGVIFACMKDIFGTGSTLLFVHHDIKTHESTRGRPEEEAAAGAGAWLDNSDFGIHIVKRKRKNELLVSVPRQRFMEDPPALRCQFSDSLLIDRLPDSDNKPTVVREMPKPGLGPVLDARLDRHMTGY